MEVLIMKCEKCGSENIVVGKLSTGMGGLVFTTKKAQEKLPFTDNYSVLSASACKDCGGIFDWKVLNPEKLKNDE
jgi:predicted Zn-ribbon and HTH transcriptional regulator